MFFCINIRRFYIVIFVLLSYLMLSQACYVYSKEYDASSIDDIIIVECRQEALNVIADILKDHKGCVTISYSGISRDFRHYKKNNYIDFLDELSFKNGYYTGIISGMCISINNSGNESVSFQFNYLTTVKQEKYISKQAKKIAKKYKGQSRYNKIKGAHDYITDHTSYDNKHYNPYYVFRKGRGICMSYALAFQRILMEMKIPCIYVKGNNHAWNMVKLDGSWYGVDVTWDDSRGSYTYFLKGTEDFVGHDSPDSKLFKRLKKAKYSYNR